MSIELPTCLEAEQAVLGAMLLSGDGFHRIADVLRPDDFSEEIHRRIFGVAEALAQEGRPTNAIMVLHHLGDHDLGDGMSTRQYLANLCAGERIATAATLVPMAKHVREIADMRQLVQAAQRTIEQASAGIPGLKPSRLAADLIADADSIVSAAVPASMHSVSIGQAGRSAYAEAAERRAGKPSSGVQTGLGELDSMIGTLEPGQGSLLAGRPSMGKTAVALSIAHNVARAGHGVLYVSLEMGAVSLATRVLSLVTAEQGAGVPYFRLAKGHVSAIELAAAEKASGALEGLPFVIEQRPGLAVSQIIAKARQVKQQFADRGAPLALVVVDHLGLVRPSRPAK